MAEINPDVIHKIDFFKYIDTSAELRQIPAGVVIDSDIARKVVEAQKKQAEMMQMAEMANAGGQAMEALGKGEQALQVVGGEDAASNAA